MSRRPGPVGREGEGESFLSRWSRRKLERENDELPIAGDEDALRDRESAGEAAGEPEPEQRVLTDDDMPDVETIDENSVVADFFSPGVSRDLRTKALRKLFHSGKFNVRDGLDDYDGDYTRFEKLGDIVTADMRHRMQMQAEKLRERELARLAEAGDPGDEAEGVVRAADEPADDGAADVEETDGGGEPVPPSEKQA